MIEHVQIPKEHLDELHNTSNAKEVNVSHLHNISNNGRHIHDILSE